MVDVRANPDYEPSSPFGAHKKYKEFLCTEESEGKECGFQVRAKTEDEVIEHAHMHQALAHGLEEPVTRDESADPRKNKVFHSSNYLIMWSKQRSNLLF